MALDRLIPNSTTPGPITGDAFMDAVAEELTGLWDRSAIKLGTIGGTANAVTAIATPALTAALVDGMKFNITPTADNTTAVTLQIGGGAVVPIVDRDGVALAAGQFKSGRHFLLIYDGVSAKHHIIGDSATTSTAVRLDFQTFSVSGTWTKPGGFSANALVYAQMWGSGGSGSTASNGGGGGGGAYASKVFRLSDLGATEAVTVGTAPALNTAGNISQFNALTAYGGGASSAATGGGGGAGIVTAGSLSTTAVGGAGGRPVGGTGGGASTAGTGSNFGGGGGGGSNAAGGESVWGGGGGGGGGATPGNGGSSVWGGGGGGGANGTGGTATGGPSLYGGAGGGVNAAGTAPGGAGGRNATGAAGRVDVWVLG